jgi:hypothetical protein
MIFRTRLACLLIAALFLLSAGAISVDNVSAAVPEPEWQEAAPLPYPVYLAATVQDDSYNLYIIGGRVGVGTPSYDNMTLYDLETEQVTQLASMPIGVSGAAAAIGPDEQIYVFGGKNLSLPNIYQYQVQIYDPEHDTWSEGAGMPVPVTIAEAVAMPNGLIYIIGGLNETIDPNEPRDLVQIYDPVADSWSAGASMPEPRYSGAAIAIGENVIMYIGGSNPAISYTYSDVQYYRVDYNYWMGSMNPFPEKYAGGDALLMPDGMVYMVGGGRGNSAFSTSSQTTASGFCMDLYHSEFVYLPDMEMDRKYHSVGYDEEGNIFVIGGYSFDAPTGETTGNASKLKVMDLQTQWFPQGRDILTGEQLMVIADFNFAFAPYESLTARAEIRNSDGDVVSSTEVTAYVQDGNPGYFYVDVPQSLPSGDYDVRFSGLHPSDYSYDDLTFEGFGGPLTFVHSASVYEQLDEQNETIGDLQDRNDALQNDLADANDKLDAMATNLLIVMIIAIIAVIVAVIILVLALRKKA